MNMNECIFTIACQDDCLHIGKETHIGTTGSIAADQRIFSRMMHIWVIFCRTGKMSKLCLKDFIFETSLRPNGLIFSRFLNCFEELLFFGVA